MRSPWLTLAAKIKNLTIGVTDPAMGIISTVRALICSKLAGYAISEVVMENLTKRESEILFLAGEGLSAQQIADMLFCSRRTVEFHLANLYSKLKVSNRVQALKRAGSLGLIYSFEQREAAAR